MSARASCAGSTSIAGPGSAPPPRSASRASRSGGAWSGTASAIRSACRRVKRPDRRRFRDAPPARAGPTGRAGTPAAPSPCPPQSQKEGRMAKGSSIGGSVALGGVLVALVLRATTLHSVNGAPLVYRVVSNVNDIDAVEGLAPPGRVVELWAKQRNFKEGTDDASDPFAWCGWKNGGNAVRPGVAPAHARGGRGPGAPPPPGPPRARLPPAPRAGPPPPR